jgi:hypothetical protein
MYRLGAGLLLKSGSFTFGLGKVIQSFRREGGGLSVDYKYLLIPP